MKTVWEKYNEQQMEAVKEFNQGYKKYISDCKTERECVVESIRIAEEYGYKNLKDLIASQTAVKTGDKVYYNNMGKSLIKSILIGTISQLYFDKILFTISSFSHSKIEHIE